MALFMQIFVLQFAPTAFDKAIDSGINIVKFSRGIPSKEVIEKIKNAGIVLGIQVTSIRSAKAAIEASADYLVCQGTEAG